MPDSPAWAGRARLELLAAAVLCALLAVVWIATLPASPSYGWDESMHVALPAARMRIAIAEGQWGQAFDALLGCAQYPFVQPVALAVAQSVLGGTEHVARAFGLVEWAATLFGLFVLVRLALDSMPPEERPRAARVAPWLALAFGALSPLGAAFGGTLFLEVPSACVGVWTLVAWLALWRAPSRPRALLAGVLVTAALFTKWNYGLLLGAGLLVDLALRLRPRHGRTDRFRVVPFLALVPVLALLWWFGLPLPGGFDVAAQHRAGLAGFLAGNQEFARVGAAERLFDAACLLSPPPRLFLLVLVGLAAAVFRGGRAPTRTLILVLLAAWLPVCLHPFFLERFLLPGALAWWACSPLGLACVLPRRPAFQVGVAVAVVCLAWMPLGSGRLALDSLAVMESCMPGPPRTGDADLDRRIEQYRQDEVARRQSRGTRRWLPSGGLERAEGSAFLELVAAEAGPDARIGWIGVSSEMSPAALHLGLLERGGSRARFLRDAHEPIDVGYFADPGWHAARVREWARGFDVIFWTDPPDVKDRPSRRWTRAAHEALVAGGEYDVRAIGTVDVARALQDPRRVTLFACRRKT